MKAKCFSLIIVGLFVMSLMAAIAISVPPQEEPTALPEEPEPDTVTFNSVYIFPENPIGHDWTTLTGGDEITIYVDVTTDVGFAYVNISCAYCDRILCYNGEPGPFQTEGYPMTPVGGSLYSYTFVGDYAQSGLKSYEASHYQVSHISYRIRVKETDDSVTTYPPAAEPFDAYIYPAWPPTQTNVTSQASKTTLFPGETFWVNGASNYWNSTSLPGLAAGDPPDYSKLLPVAETNVTVSVNPDYLGKTDADGNFSVEITAPMSPGMYTVNTTVTNDSKNWNGVQNRNVPCVTQEIQIEVLDLANVTLELNTTSTLPGLQINATGVAKLTNGSAAQDFNVTARIVETDVNWTTKTNATGNYYIDVTAPITVGTYTLNVTCENTTYGLVAYNQTTFDVDAVPLPDLVISADDIVVNGTLVEGLNHKINVTVWNKGIVAVANAVVNTSINGTWLNSTNVTVAVGGSTMVEIDWTPDAGEMNISVSVDPEDDIEEKYEDNNTAYKVVNVLVDTDGDEIPDATDTDDDGDGYNDEWEIFLGTDPLDPLDKPLDTDLDGEPDGDVNNTEDWMDIDDDDDGVSDMNDLYPLDPTEWADDDGDGIGNAADPDDDSDGYLDATDDPHINDTDNDGLINGLDPDDDNDDIPDITDTMPFDTDNDGQNNDVDTDDDGDGLADVNEDANWNGLVEAGVETDYLNPDTDGDGQNDLIDLYPLDPTNTPVQQPPSSNTAFIIGAFIVIIVVVVVILMAYIKFFKPEL